MRFIRRRKLWFSRQLKFVPYAIICRESNELEEDAGSNGSVKRQVKLSSLGFTGFKRKSEEIDSSGKGRCKFFQARKLELVRKFQWCVSASLSVLLTLSQSRRLLWGYGLYFSCDTCEFSIMKALMVILYFSYELVGSVKFWIEHLKCFSDIYLNCSKVNRIMLDWFYALDVFLSNGKLPKQTWH